VLNEERKQVAMELNVEPAVSDTISLHPAVLARYEQQLVQLQDALSKGINAGDSDAAEAIRDLVETVTVFRDPSRAGGVTIEIVGRLNALLGEQAYPNKVRGVWGKMVAGARCRFSPPDPILRYCFGLLPNPHYLVEGKFQIRDTLVNEFWKCASILGALLSYHNAPDQLA
jgi:hypothetical protein